MMKILVFASAALAASALCADVLTEDENDANGGVVIRETDGSGRVILVNEQTVVPAADIASVVAVMRNWPKINIHVGDANTPRGRLFVRVRNDPAGASTILVSPDEGWANVNVARLAADGTTGDALANRVRIATLRATFLLCGGGGSQMPKTILGPAPRIADYDGFKLLALPPESFSRIQTYLHQLGIEPVSVMSYEEACQQGLAPKPKTKSQREIWDEVHKLPTNPLPLVKPTR